MRGCDGKSKAPIMAPGIKGSARRCPVVDFFEFGEYLSVYRYWQQGQFPNDGTWAEQPNRLVKIMEFIDGQLSQ